MRKPTYKGCTDEYGIFDAECYEEACDRYSDSERDRILEEEWDKPRLTSQKMNKQSVVYKELEARYTEVETAVKWWNNIRTK